MHEVAQLPWGVALAYLVAGVLFILALRGLSSPATSRAGNRYGMAGMAIAVATTLIRMMCREPAEILGAIAIGGHRLGHRPQDRDDGHAAAGGRVPLAGRYGGGAGRCAASSSPAALRHWRRPGQILPASRIEMGWASPSARSPSPARSSRS
jgi:hypothetical protein